MKATVKGSNSVVFQNCLFVISKDLKFSSSEHIACMIYGILLYFLQLQNKFLYLCYGEKFSQNVWRGQRTCMVGVIAHYKWKGLTCILPRAAGQQRDKYRLLHRKCDVRIFIHELQDFGKRTSERSSLIRFPKSCNEHFLCCNLFIVYITRIKQTY